MFDYVLLSIKIYALAIVISMAVAVMIKLIVLVASGRKPQARPVVQPRGTVAAAGPPAEHVAAIAAAIYAYLGAHRIVHIEERSRNRAWTAEGRTAHHVSHNVPHHPHR
jgi:hypothetical protein